MAMMPPNAPPRPPAGRPAGRPAGPPAGGMNAAGRAADAHAEVSAKMRDTITASMPTPTEPLPAAQIEAVADIAGEIAKKLGAPGGLPTWQAPKGVREVEEFPREIYMLAMAVLLLAQKTLPPEMAGKYAADPSMFGSAAGLKQLVGLLGALKEDDKALAAIEANASKLMGGGAPEKPEMPEKPEKEEDTEEVEVEDYSSAGAY